MMSGHRGWLGTRPPPLKRTAWGFLVRAKSGASRLPGRRRPVARSAYSFRSSIIGMIALLWRIERIARPQPDGPLENGSERESGDNVARPVGQNHDARQRKPDREGADRSARRGRKRAGRRGERAHMQRVAGRKGVLALTGEGDTVNVAYHRPAIWTSLVEQAL